MDKQQLIGSIFRIFATGGSGFRIADWCRRRIGRKMTIGLQYTEEGACWELTLLNPDGSERFDETSNSLEGVVVRAVVALGKEM